MKHQVIGETNTKEANNKNVETNNVVNKKQETKKVEPQANKEQEQKKEEQPVIIKPEAQETKQEVKQTQENKQKQCTNDKHMIETGNSKRWFKTEQEAINLYDKLQKEWSNKLINGETTEKEYDANCPYGYETWDCPNCQNWTINFYYR